VEELTQTSKRSSPYRRLDLKQEEEMEKEQPWMSTSGQDELQNETQASMSTSALGGGAR
jgi:hypothetical protein